MTFVERQADVDQIADEENELLENDVGVDFEALEGLCGGEDCLQRANQAHADHHDGKN